MQIAVLDHGYVEFIEPWGHGAANIKIPPEKDYHSPRTDYEVGIIEAARQSTQGSFRGWEPAPCDCGPRNRFRDSNPTIHTDDCASVKNPGDKRLLEFLYTKGHNTPFEFAGMVLEIQAPLMVFREWQRHRTQSYSEASARYAPLPAINYHISDEDLLRRARAAIGTKNRQASSTGNYEEDLIVQWNQEDKELTDILRRHYEKGLMVGVPKELARKKMPLDHYSRMRCCVNLRNWLHFLTLRMDPAAMEETRLYANIVGQLVEQNFPKTWDLFKASL
jgi:thymidylate synthase (FAD)